MNLANNIIITSLRNPAEVTTLPPGCFVGDTCGGRSFTDNIAVALERRSRKGWQEIEHDDQRWTVIVIER